jgi:hypothetical protein
MDGLEKKEGQIFLDCFLKEVGKLAFYALLWPLMGVAFKMYFGGLSSENKQYISSIVDVVRDKTFEIALIIPVFFVMYGIASGLRYFAKSKEWFTGEKIFLLIQNVTIAEGGSAFYAWMTLLITSIAFRSLYSSPLDFISDVIALSSFIAIVLVIIAFIQSHKENERISSQTSRKP